MIIKKINLTFDNDEWKKWIKYLFKFFHNCFKF